MARRAPTDESTRDRILAAAWSLFQRQSTSRFTLAELADRIGLHYTVLYHYFKNKSDLETEIIERHCAGRSRRLSEACSNPGSGFSHLIDFIHAEMRQQPINLLAKQYDVFTDPYRTRVNKAFERNAREIVRVLEAGIQDGSIRRCRPGLVASVILRILNRYANQNEDILAQAGLSANSLADEIASFLGHGLLAAGSRRLEMPKTPFAAFPQMQTADSNLDLMLRTLTTVLNERGYDSTSIPEVASSIGLSKTSFYRYAANKQELLYLAAHRSLSLTLQLRLVSHALGTNPLEILLHIIYYARYLLDNFPGPTMRPAMFDYLDEERARATWDIFTGTRFDTIHLLNKGMAQGLFRKADARAVQPMLTSVMNVGIRAEHNIDEGFLDEVVQFALYGIGASEL